MGSGGEEPNGQDLTPVVVISFGAKAFHTEAVTAWLRGFRERNGREAMEIIDFRQVLDDKHLNLVWGQNGMFPNTCRAVYAQGYAESGPGDSAVIQLVDKLVRQAVVERQVRLVGGNCTSSFHRADVMGRICQSVINSLVGDNGRQLFNCIHISFSEAGGRNDVVDKLNTADNWSKEPHTVFNGPRREDDRYGYKMCQDSVAGWKGYKMLWDWVDKHWCTTDSMHEGAPPTDVPPAASPVIAASSSPVVAGHRKGGFVQKDMKKDAASFGRTAGSRQRSSIRPGQKSSSVAIRPLPWANAASASTGRHHRRRRDGVALCKDLSNVTFEGESDGDYPGNEGAPPTDVPPAASPVIAASSSPVVAGHRKGGFVQKDMKKDAASFGRTAGSRQQSSIRPGQKSSSVIINPVPQATAASASTGHDDLEDPPMKYDVPEWARLGPDSDIQCWWSELDAYKIDDRCRKNLILLSQMSRRGHFEAVNLMWDLQKQSCDGSSYIMNFSKWLDKGVTAARQTVNEAQR